MAARFAMAAVRVSPSGTPMATADEQQQMQQFGDGKAHAAAAAASAAAAGLSPPVASLLLQGGLLTAYIPECDGSNSYFTRVLSLFPELSAAPGPSAASSSTSGGAPTASNSASGVGVTLYWCEAGRRELRPSRAIPLSSLRCILVGKHTCVLQWSAISADPERCFSLQWGDECLDLECDTEAQRTHWLTLLDHLLAVSGRRVIEQPEVAAGSGADAGGAELDGGPIDPLSFLTRRSASMGDAAAYASGSAAVAAASTGAVATAAPANAFGDRGGARVQLPSPDRFFAHIGSAVDLDFSTQKHKRFVVLDPTPSGDDPSSPAAATLADTLHQFQQWIDATPLQPPSVPPGPAAAVEGSGAPTRTSLRTDTGGLAVPPSAKSLPPTPSHRRQGSSAAPVAPKDDPRSLEGSLSRLGAGVFFQYCSPPSEVDPSTPALARLASTILAAAAANGLRDGAASPSSVSLPGEVPPALTRPQSLSEVMTSIVLFYAPHARRATERSGRNFGQLSWCDSQVWTRKAAWKLPLHVDSVILLGKRSSNLQRPIYASLAESSCFSIVNGGEGAFGHSVDLFAEGGWPAIRAWLHDVDRILRSGGYALARAGGMASPAPASAFNSPSVGSSNGSLKTLPLLAAPLGLCTRLVFVSQADLAKSATVHAERVRPPSVGLLQLGQGPPLASPVGSGAGSVGGGGGGGHRRELSKAPQLFTFPSVNSTTTHSLFSATASMTADASLGSGGSSTWAGSSSTWAGGSSLAAPSSSASIASLHVRAGSRDLQVPYGGGGCPPTAEPSPSNRSALRNGAHNRRQNSHPLPPLDHLTSGQPCTPAAAPSPTQPLVSGLASPGAFALPLVGHTNGQQTPAQAQTKAQTQPPVRAGGHARGLSVTIHGVPAPAQTPPVLAIDPHAPVDESAAARALSPPGHPFVAGSPRSRPPLPADSSAASASAHRRAPSGGISLPPLQNQTPSTQQQQQQQQPAQPQSFPASASLPHADSAGSAANAPLTREPSVSRSPHMLSMSTAPRSPSQLPLTNRLQHLQML